jgi:predicted adenine nucleotide alpha hydrolase (AANH) superfamily ATPase
MERKRLLLHCCCGPCSTSSIERLRELGFEPVLFFGNSNIFPEAEAETRFRALKQVADHFSLDVVRREYHHESWLEEIAGHEEDPERGPRCAICFAYNLREAAEEARRLKISYFTTTLTVSPHKSAPTLFSIGEELAGFVAVDFKKKDGFKRSIELSKELDLYRQDYCGCEFSLR